ncbi:MAG: tRNA (guanosine(46)-N7)-methyltransferase TrmB [Patescibacteria group bacterium]|jgi:tRNA (guanine-N7-)-methyltransferase
MSRQKLKKFAELDKFANVAQFNRPDIKNKLNDFLLGKHQIILELGCGRGEYSLALAKKEKTAKIVSIDIQGERLWAGARQAQIEKLDNILFLRIQIEDLLEYFFPKSITEIWITFPDPYPRDKQIKKRLTSPRFLDVYKKILINNAVLHLKTDDLNLFDYSIESIINHKGKIIKKIKNIYKAKNIPKILKIKTEFEKKHLKAGKTINYLKFSL